MKSGGEGGDGAIQQPGFSFGDLLKTDEWFDKPLSAPKLPPPLLQEIQDDQSLADADKAIDTFKKDPSWNNAKKCLPGIGDKISIGISRFWRDL